MNRKFLKTFEFSTELCRSARGQGSMFYFAGIDAL